MPGATFVAAEVPTTANGSQNGVNGHDSHNHNHNHDNDDDHDHGHTSRTPSLSGLSLTEYSANPTPPSETNSNRITDIIPAEFILPSGHPDVGLAPRPSLSLATTG